MQCQVEKTMGSKPHAFVDSLFDLHTLFGSIFSAAENKNKAMNMCCVLCGTTLRLFCCYHRQTHLHRHRHQHHWVWSSSYTCFMCRSVAIAIDGITFHIENNIYPHRIIFTVCAPNHEGYTWKKWKWKCKKRNQSVFVVSMHFDWIVLLLYTWNGCWHNVTIII